MTMTDYVRYHQEEAPAKRRPVHKYNWPAHAAYLRQHPNEWVRLEETAGVGAINEVKRGNQKDMAALMPYLHIITRNSRTEASGRRVASMIAKYTPGEEAVSTRRTLTDEEVVAARFAFARGEKNGRELAREYEVQPGSMYTILYGTSRRDAGGPYGRSAEEREEMLAELETEIALAHSRDLTNQHTI